LDFFDVSVGFGLESLNVNGNDNMKVGNGTSHFANFFEDDVVDLDRGNDGKQNNDGDHDVGVLVTEW
jgi:hypothetical protein